MSHIYYPNLIELLWQLKPDGINIITAIPWCRAGHEAAEKMGEVFKLGIWRLYSWLHRQKFVIGHHNMAALLSPTGDHQKWLKKYIQWV